jgi:hypothetical protein
MAYNGIKRSPKTYLEPTEASDVSDNKLSLVLVRDGLNQSGFQTPLGQNVALDREPPVDDPT